MNEDQALPQITIDTESGQPYVSAIDGGSVIGIQLHDYTSRVVVHLDKQCIPDLIRALKLIQKRDRRQNRREIRSRLGYSRIGLNNV